MPKPLSRALPRLLAAALTALIALAPGSPMAQGMDGPIPEARIVHSRDVDFYGGDLRTLLDTTLEGCERACLSEDACAGFTFNARSNACFPKRSLGERQPYDGAVSGVKITPAPGALARAQARLDDLPALSTADIAAARAETLEIGRRYAPGPWAQEDLRRGAAQARLEGRRADALAWSGAAAAISDDAADWSAHARDLLARADTAASGDAPGLGDRAIAAALNAYLRAGEDGLAAQSLGTMARALILRERGQQALALLRHATALSRDPGLAVQLDNAIAQYGFRVTDSRVEADSAEPRICLTFSEPLDTRVDYIPYLRLPGTAFAADASGRDLCLTGVSHGQRVALSLRAGLPSAQGEPMARDAQLAFYIRDRAPSLRFPGQGYVLPKVAGTGVPLVSVNLAEAQVILRRMPSRNLTRAIGEGLFGRPLSAWEESMVGTDMAEEIWRGTAPLDSPLNAEVTTRLPLDAALAEQPPGIYLLQASVPGADPWESPPATQWFVISDIGIATAQGADGLLVTTRRLSDAQPAPGLTVQLISRANRVLAEAATDATGAVRFAPGLMRGPDGAAPALVTVLDAGTGDGGFLSLTGPEFDLSDRGVEGRAAPGPVDAFVATDRGAYRAGETVHVTALLRDAAGAALPNLPLTAILSRPDGVEHLRHTSAAGLAGGHVLSLPIAASAPRGTWRLAVHADPGAPALAETRLLVEDFLPERLDLTLTAPDTPARPGDVVPLSATARYLFGAPGAGLRLEGEMRLSARTGMPGWPGYSFGRHDDSPPPQVTVLTGAVTDADGTATLPLPLPVPGTETPRPMEARATLRVIEGAGRPVERSLTLPVAPSGPVIGIRPLAAGPLPEGAEAGFDVIGLAATGTPLPMQIRWTVNRIETRYQWFSRYGSWEWEPITRRIRIATGDGQTGNAPLRIAAGVNWGTHELIVERLDGANAASSVGFSAGWFAAEAGPGTPDRLDIGLDRTSYAVGDTARLRVNARAATPAELLVLTDRVVERRLLTLAQGDTVIELPVSADWGAGAYLAVAALAPLDARAERLPNRALGIVHAGVDRPERRLSVTLDTPDLARPRSPLDVTLRIAGAAPGDAVYASLAATDLGILNLTGHQPPDPETYLLGQRRLGVGLRDLYGRLIDGFSGRMGALRQGGDASASLRRQAEPPTQDLMAQFAGPLTVRPDGTVQARFDLPAFNGTVRLAAIAWSARAVGASHADVLVRDPVVMAEALPRFLSPGDSTRMGLDLTHADGPEGPATLTVTAPGLLAEPLTQTVQIARGTPARVTLPLTAPATAGPQTIALRLETPGGQVLERTLTLAVRNTDPATARTTRFSLAPGQSFTLTADALSGFAPGTVTASLTLGPLGRLDAAGLIQRLDSYPYGCTEQVTSRALPLLALPSVAAQAGIASAADIPARVQQAIDTILARQSASGGFGLWRPGAGDLWLDAYVTDFLTRARSAGHPVPERALAAALDTLARRVNTAPDFDSGGADLAYALMVLAREGKARMGDLRYYADVKAQALSTPLAQAQLGAALAFYGDQPRADALFAMAGRGALAQGGDSGWRDDYGTARRDAAGVLALAVAAGSTAVDRDALITRAAAPAGTLSTQEAAWSLLAAQALAGDVATQALVNGAPAPGPVLRVTDGTARDITIANNGPAPLDLTLTALGQPETPGPAGGDGFAIERAYYTRDGQPVDPSRVATGTRLVAVLTVTPFARADGRLMVEDPLPAGFEIENPTLLRAGDIRALDWIAPAAAQHAEFLSDRFQAAVDWRSDTAFRLAYAVRATRAGDYHHPPALIEDMYRPHLRAVSAPGRVTVSD